MAKIKSTSYSADWMRTTSAERQVYLRRACQRLTDLGVSLPSLSLLEQRMTRKSAETCNADLDVGQLLEQAIAELHREGL